MRSGNKGERERVKNSIEFTGSNKNLSEWIEKATACYRQEPCTPDPKELTWVPAFTFEF